MDTNSMLAFPLTSEVAALEGMTLGAHHRAPNGKLYQLVKLDTGTADVDTVVGAVAYYANSAGTTVTSDITDSVGDQTSPAGTFLAAGHTDDYYIWILKHGSATLLGDASGINAGDPLVAHSDDGEVQLMAAGEEDQVIARALADGGDTTPFSVLAITYFP